MGTRPSSPTYPPPGDCSEIHPIALQALGRIYRMDVCNPSHDTRYYSRVFLGHLSFFPWLWGRKCMLPPSHATGYGIAQLKYLGVFYR